MNWTNPNFNDKEKNNIYIENETQTEVKQETNNSNFTPLSEILNNNDNDNDNKNNTNYLKFEECCEFPKFATITGAPSNLSLDSASVGKLTTMHDSYLGKYLK